jgi:hypothetical protein
MQGQVRISRITYVLIVFAIFCSHQTHAQFDSLGINTRWATGSIVLNDDTFLQGIVQFNDKMGLIKFKKTDDSQEESFVESRILSMEFYDEASKLQRHFATFDFEEPESGWRGSLLFEVLMDFKRVCTNNKARASRH